MKQGFRHLIDEYLEQLQERTYSPRTISRKHKTLRQFQSWCAENGLFHPAEVTRKHVNAYCGSLLLRRTRDGKLVQARTRCLNLSEVRVFYRWLVDRHVVLADPTDQLEIRSTCPRPGDLLTAAEIDLIMAQPDLRTVSGIRNRTILETFYATGIRCRELISLHTRDIGLQTQTMWIRRGKGNRDRLVPIGDRGCVWLQRYLEAARPALIIDFDPGHPFLTFRGRPFQPDSIGDIVRDAIRQSGIKKRGACHLFRRAMATGMLENGADIRSVQEMLGHTSLRSTQKYTLLADTSLKQVHKRTHPFERELSAVESYCQPSPLSTTQKGRLKTK